MQGLPSSVYSIEQTARKIMLTDAKIWERHGWEDGGAVVPDVYRKELKAELAKMKIRKLDPIYYSIFEDANWHTMNEALLKLGVFERYPSEVDDKVYRKYRSMGGKTWELT